MHITSLKRHGWLWLLFLTSFQVAATTQVAPYRLQVSMLNSVLGYESNVQKKKSLSIYVLGDSDIIWAFSRFSLNKHTRVHFKKPDYGPQLPNQAYDLIYISRSEDIDSGLEYAKRHGAIIVGATPELVKDGATLGVILMHDKATILINRTVSNELGLQWNEKLFRIVTSIH